MKTHIHALTYLLLHEPELSIVTQPMALIPGFFFIWRNSPTRAMASSFYITHNDEPQSVGHLWTSDELVAETST